MIELVNSGVVFEEEAHTYTLNGKLLSGITGLIKKLKFPTKYNGIPYEILMKAAEEGTKVHKSCEYADKLGVVENEEAQAYLNFQKSVLCHPVANEYTVTDGEHWASNIDCVWANEDEDIYLVDIKTTYEADEEYLSWQLSIYAYLFEKMNPTLKVKGLMGILLFKLGKSNKYGRRKLMDIKRKSTEDVEEILSHVNYDMEDVKLPEVVQNEVCIPDETLQKIIIFERQMKDLKEKEDFLKKTIKEAMEQAGVKSYKNDCITISIKAASTRESFDTKKFKEDHADIYEKYKKISPVSSSIVIQVGEHGKEEK